nr:MAG TPA: hypothetical protein [Caudoviricetes sp.]
MIQISNSEAERLARTLTTLEQTTRMSGILNLKVQNAVRVSKLLRTKIEARLLDQKDKNDGHRSNP